MRNIEMMDLGLVWTWLRSCSWDMDIDAIFPKSVCFRKKKQFDETNYNEVIQTVEDDFKNNYFLIVVDMTIISLNNGFEQMRTFEMFSFFYIIQWS